MSKTLQSIASASTLDELKTTYAQAIASNGSARNKTVRRWEKAFLARRKELGGTKAKAKAKKATTPRKRATVKV